MKRRDACVLLVGLYLGSAGQNLLWDVENLAPWRYGVSGYAPLIPALLWLLWKWRAKPHDPNCAACNGAWPWCEACRSYHSPCNPTCKLH